MSGIDKAAEAFDTDMGNAPIRSEEGPASMGMDEVFPARQKETDVVAGGDDLDPPFGNNPGDHPARKDEPRELSEDEILYGEEKDPADPADGEEGDEEEPRDEDEDDELLDLSEIGDKMVKITIDGKEKVVPLTEATQGYIRVQTFHQRMNEVEEARGVLREEATNLLEDKRRVVAQLDELIQQSEALLPKEPDWDDLFAKDPAKARNLQKQYQDFTGKIGEFKQARARAQNEMRAQVESDTVKFAAEERRKFEDANPHWKSDPEKKKKDISSMVRTARTHKFTDAEIAQVLDSRMLGILLKASKYDRMMAARPRSIPRGKPPVKPGTGRTRTVPKGVDRSQQMLARTGSVEHAADVFTNMIRKG